MLKFTTQNKDGIETFPRQEDGRLDLEAYYQLKDKRDEALSEFKANEKEYKEIFQITSAYMAIFHGGHGDTQGNQGIDQGLFKVLAPTIKKPLTEHLSDKQREALGLEPNPGKKLGNKL